MNILTRQQIIQALEELGVLAHQQAQTIELVVMGGAAMVLMYNARPANPYHRPFSGRFIAQTGRASNQR